MANVHSAPNNTIITTTAPNINSIIKPVTNSAKPLNESLATSGRITDTISAIHKNKKVYKIIVVGDSSVGKTTLTYRFCEGKFLENIQSTIGVDFRSRTVTINGEDVTLQLWDTAGQEKYRMSMIRHYYRNVHAIVFVYDVTNAASFDSLGRWIEECDKHCSREVPRILVGNKCDGVVAVTTNVAQRFADQHNMPLFETSARLDSQCDNVDAIFLTIAHKLKNCKQFIPRPATVEITVPDQPEPPKSTWYC